jgi:hypothetical protein
MNPGRAKKNPTQKNLDATEDRYWRQNDLSGRQNRDPTHRPMYLASRNRHPKAKIEAGEEHDKRIFKRCAWRETQILTEGIKNKNQGLHDRVTVVRSAGNFKWEIPEWRSRRCPQLENQKADLDADRYWWENEHWTGAKNKITKTKTQI